MQLSKFTDYSLRMLIYMAEHPDRLVTINEVAQWYGTPKQHFVKIAHNLVKLGYVKSMRGKGGGLCLNKKPEEINLGKVVRETEPNFRIVECFDEAHVSCRITGTCKLKGVLRESVRQFYDVLDRNSLSSIIA